MIKLENGKLILVYIEREVKLKKDSKKRVNLNQKTDCTKKK